MTANIITGLFGKYLQFFFKGFTNDLLHIDMFKGIASVRNMEMREDIMQELLDVDFLDVKRVFVPQLTIRFSLTNLKTQPISISIERIDFFLEEAVRGRPKTTILSDFFGAPRHPTPPTASEKAKAEEKAKSGSYGFMDKVVDGLQVNVGEVVFTLLLRRRPGRPMPPKLVVRVSDIACYTTNHCWEVVPLKQAREFNVGKQHIYVFKEARATLNVSLLSSSYSLTPVLSDVHLCAHITLKKKMNNAFIGVQIDLLINQLKMAFNITQIFVLARFIDAVLLALDIQEADSEAAKRPAELSALVNILVNAWQIEIDLPADNNSNANTSSSTSSSSSSNNNNNSSAVGLQISGTQLEIGLAAMLEGIPMYQKQLHMIVPFFALREFRIAPNDAGVTYRMFIQPGNSEAQENPLSTITLAPTKTIYPAPDEVAPMVPLMCMSMLSRSPSQHPAMDNEITAILNPLEITLFPDVFGRIEYLMQLVSENLMIADFDSANKKKSGGAAGGADDSGFDVTTQQPSGLTLLVSRLMSLDVKINELAIIIHSEHFPANNLKVLISQMQLQSLPDLPRSQLFKSGLCSIPSAVFPSSPSDLYALSPTDFIRQFMRTLTFRFFFRLDVSIEASEELGIRHRQTQLPSGNVLSITLVDTQLLFHIGEIKEVERVMLAHDPSKTSQEVLDNLLRVARKQVSHVELAIHIGLLKVKLLHPHYVFLLDLVDEWISTSTRVAEAIKANQRLVKIKRRDRKLMELMGPNANPPPSTTVTATTKMPSSSSASTSSTSTSSSSSSSSAATAAPSSTRLIPISLVFFLERIEVGLLRSLTDDSDTLLTIANLVLRQVNVVAERHKSGTDVAKASIGALKISEPSKIQEPLGVGDHDPLLLLETNHGTSEDWSGFIDIEPPFFRVRVDGNKVSTAQSMSIQKGDHEGPQSEVTARIGVIRLNLNTTLIAGVLKFVVPERDSLKYRKKITMMQHDQLSQQIIEERERREQLLNQKRSADLVRMERETRQKRIAQEANRIEAVEKEAGIVNPTEESDDDLNNSAAGATPSKDNDVVDDDDEKKAANDEDGEKNTASSGIHQIALEFSRPTIRFGLEQLSLMAATPEVVLEVCLRDLSGVSRFPSGHRQEMTVGLKHISAYGLQKNAERIDWCSPFGMKALLARNFDTATNRWNGNASVEIDRMSLSLADQHVLIIQKIIEGLQIPQLQRILTEIGLMEAAQGVTTVTKGVSAVLFDYHKEIARKKAHETLDKINDIVQQAQDALESIQFNAPAPAAQLQSSSHLPTLPGLLRLHQQPATSSSSSSSSSSKTPAAAAPNPSPAPSSTSTSIAKSSVTIETSRSSPTVQSTASSPRSDPDFDVVTKSGFLGVSKELSKIPGSSPYYIDLLNGIIYVYRSAPPEKGPTLAQLRLTPTTVIQGHDQPVANIFEVTTGELSLFFVTKDANEHAEWVTSILKAHVISALRTTNRPRTASASVSSASTSTAEPTKLSSEPTPTPTTSTTPTTSVPTTSTAVVVAAATSGSGAQALDDSIGKQDQKSSQEIIELLRQVHSSTTSLHHQLEDVMDVLFFADDLSLRQNILSLESDLLKEHEDKRAMQERIRELELRVQELSTPAPKNHGLDPETLAAMRAKDLAQREEFERMKKRHQQTPPAKPPPKVQTWGSAASLGIGVPTPSATSRAPATTRTTTTRPSSTLGTTSTARAAPATAARQQPATATRTSPATARAGSSIPSPAAGRSQRIARPE